jgi:hypothetical protein
MDNINIDKIFGNSSGKVNSSRTNLLTVDTIVRSNGYKMKINENDILNKIKFVKTTEKNKIVQVYEEKYIQCLTNIDSSISYGLTDIIFSVNLGCFGVPNYDSVMCLKYIEKKLKTKKFLTMIISPTEIFISWKNIADII